MNDGAFFFDFSENSSNVSPEIAFTGAAIKDGALILRRDPLGTRPIFYTTLGQRLIFASNIRALLKQKGVDATLDKNGLAELFALGPARPQQSVFLKGIYSLPPGHVLRVEKGQKRIQPEPYWDFPARLHIDDEKETVSFIKKMLTEAILHRLPPCESNCSLLSGGVDSSVITAIAAEHYRNAGKQLTTLSFEFLGSRGHSNTTDSDRPWVEKMVEFCKTNHEIIGCSAEDLAYTLYAAVDARGLPGMADIDSSLLFFCSKRPSGITTALTGECADEIFGGYPWFDMDNIAPNVFPWSRGFIIRKALLKDEFVDELQLEEVVAKHYKETIALCPKGIHDSASQTLIERQYLTLKWFMPVLMERMNRMGEYSGLSAIVPFADVALMEYVWNTPWSLKRKNGVVKYLLREAARGIIPDEVLFRKKSPFPKTYASTYTSIVSDQLREVLVDTTSPVRAFVDTQKAEQFIEAIQNEADMERPWFGQLMAASQMIAYILQINYWLRKYQIRLDF